MFKKQSATLFVMGLCLLCAGSAGAASRASAVLSTFCAQKTNNAGLIAQEEAAIDNIVSFAVPTGPGIEQYENYFVEYVLPAGGQRDYFMQPVPGSSAGGLQGMRDMLRTAYMTGAPVAYCYVADPNGYRQIKGMAILTGN